MPVETTNRVFIPLLTPTYRGPDATLQGFATMVRENFQRLNYIFLPAVEGGFEFPTPATNAPPQIAAASALGTVTQRFAREDHTHALTSTTPAAGDIAKFDGTNWVKLTPASKTIVTAVDLRWDSTNKRMILSYSNEANVKIIEAGSTGSGADEVQFDAC
jgi:hypothetical protein